MTNVNYLDFKFVNIKALSNLLKKIILTAQVYTIIFLK